MAFKMKGSPAKMGMIKGTAGHRSALKAMEEKAAMKAMEKAAKREKKLAEKRAKRQAKSGTKKSEDKTIPLDQVITLDHLTNPNKK